MKTGTALAAVVMLAATAGHAEEFRMTMSDQTYAPAVIEAEVGDSIVFVNDDDTAHEVLIPTVGFAADLGQQDPFTDTSLTLERAGVFDVECVLHDQMHARVVVRP